MNWNRKNDCWAELKGQAKRQIQETQNEVYKLTDVKQIKHGRESLASNLTVNARAEKQLSELKDLLKNMCNFQNEIANNIYQKTTNLGKD